MREESSAELPGKGRSSVGDSAVTYRWEFYASPGVHPRLTVKGFKGCSDTVRGDLQVTDVFFFDVAGDA